jgi:hypothetical protein
MRIAFSVPKERGYIRSGYPSEPLLAEAAARQMDKFQTLTPNTNVMLEALEDEFSSGLLDQGQRGGVVFRLLLSEAYRRGVRKDYANDSPYNFSKGCKLTTFMEELCSKDYAKQILDSVPDRRQHQNFNEFSDGVQRRHCSFHTFREDGRRHWNDNTRYVRCIRPVHGNHRLVFSGNRGHFNSRASRP